MPLDRLSTKENIYLFLQIRSLLSFEVAFSSVGLSDFPSVIENSQGPKAYAEESIRRPPNDVDKVVIAPIGEFGALTHLIVR